MSTLTQAGRPTPCFAVPTRLKISFWITSVALKKQTGSLPSSVSTSIVTLSLDIGWRRRACCRSSALRPPTSLLLGKYAVPILPNAVSLKVAKSSIAFSNELLRPQISSRLPFSIPSQALCSSLGQTCCTILVNHVQI